MKKRSFAKNLTLGLIPASLLLACLFLAKEALAAKPEYEVVCRSKAKDAATEIYKTCVTENKNSQIDALKKEYELKLKSMKEDYEKELSRIAGKAVAAKEAAPAKEVAPVAKAAGKKGKAAAKAAKKANGKRTVVVPMQSAPATSSAPTDEVLETRTVPADEFDGSSMDIPEPIPVYVPEEQLPSEVY